MSLAALERKYSNAIAIAPAQAVAPIVAVPDPAVIPAAVLELGELLANTGGAIINTPEHRGIPFGSPRRLSRLVFHDPDVVAFLDSHPFDPITDRNLISRHPRFCLAGKKAGRAA